MMPPALSPSSTPIKPTMPQPHLTLPLQESPTMPPTPSHSATLRKPQDAPSPILCTTSLLWPQQPFLVLALSRLLPLHAFHSVIPFHFWSSESDIYILISSAGGASVCRVASHNGRQIRLRPLAEWGPGCERPPAACQQGSALHSFSS